MRRHQPLIVLNVAPAYERAKPKAIIADGNIAEPAQPPQIDQQARGRQTEGEKRHQALAPGDDERFGVRREQIDCFVKGPRGLVIERRGFHCYASRGRTEPDAICTPIALEGAGCATSKRSHEHRELATAAILFV
jgi:hypothetical protein